MITPSLIHKWYLKTQHEHAVFWCVWGVENILRCDKKLSSAIEPIRILLN